MNLSALVVQVEDGNVRGSRVEENIEAYKRYLFGANRENAQLNGFAGGR